MKALPNKPVYLVPKTSPVIAKYAATFQMFEKDESLHTLNLIIPPNVVSSMDSSLMNELLPALQHYPHLIERFIFSFEFKFSQIEDSELYFQDLDWKTDAMYYRWFCKVGEAPIAIFFIHDRDARFYALAGDMLADGKCEIKKEGSDKTALIGFKENEVQELCGRLYMACWLFHIYCHGSGFDPQPAIESLIAEFDLPIIYEDIRKKYLKDIETGIQLRIVKKQNDEESVL